MLMTNKSMLIVVTLITMLFGCGEPAPPSSSSSNSTTATTEPSTDLPSFDDIFTYCSNQITIDQIGSNFIGPIPETISHSLQQQLTTNHTLPATWNTSDISLRCMDSQVFACFPVDGVPCGTKLNFSRIGNAAMHEYCVSNSNSIRIPDNVVGTESPYSWLCDGDKPSVKEQKHQTDPAGFKADMWFLIPATD